MMSNIQFSASDIPLAVVAGPLPVPAASGEAGMLRDLGSNLLRLYFLFEKCGLWTLSCDFVPHT